MDGLMGQLLGSTAVKAAATYYIVAACGLYGLLGCLSSPNPKLKRVKLRDLESTSSSVVGGSSSPVRQQQAEQESSSSSSSSAPMKRKLSFLRSNPTMLESNPFMNLSWEVVPSERVQCALCGPLLMPPRIALLFICVFTAYFWARISSIGADLDKPLPYWRIVLQKPMKLCGRGIMLALGFLHIKVKGRKASPDEAPIVVSNHISFVETIYLPARFLSMAVSAAENGKIPLFGLLMRSLQTIFVSRTDKDSRATVAREIERRTKAERGQWHRQLLIFPEGTTTNGSAIITFKAGAFAPGMPVQPVLVRYPNGLTCDPSWVTGGPGPAEIALKLLCQPFNSMEVTFLPVYKPSAEERADAILYANNVRRAMAEALGVRTTEHGFEDVLMQCEAKKLGYQGSLKECVVELKSLRKVIEIDLEGAKGYLKHFASLDTGKTGRINYETFTKVFGSRDTEELRTLFSILDIGDRGSLNFAEFLTGIALLNEQGTDRFDGTMRLAFKVYDSSGEGHGLAKADLARLLRRVCDVDMSEALVDETFKAADLDADGLLSSEEFLVLARQHQDRWRSFHSSLFSA